MEDYWSSAFLTFFSLSFLESTWHEATSKENEACWNYMEDFGIDDKGLVKVGIIAHEGLGSLGLVL